MVSRIVRFSLAALLPMALCSCGLLIESLFPMDLPQAVAMRDFSADIPAAAADTFNLGVVQPVPGAAEWVILFSSAAYPSSPHLFVMDTNLTPTQSPMTYEELSTAAGGFFGGSVVIADGLSRIVAGSLILTPSGSTLAASGGIAAGGAALWSVSFATPSWNYANLRTAGTGSSLVYEKYAASWASAASAMGPLAISTSTTAGMDIAAAIPLPGTAEVVLVFQEYVANDNRVFHFRRIPFLDFDNDSITTMTPILDKYPGFELKNLDSRLFARTPDGIICYEEDPGDFVILDPASADGTVLKLQHLRRDERQRRQQVAYSAADGSRYAYDPLTRTVVKTSPWWE